MLDRIFRLSEYRTTARREVLAGLTTFLTMAYILFVQPAILSTDFDGNPTGLERDAVLLATVVASALATLIMGLYARYPIALAPGMGQNVFFVTVVMAIAAEGVQQAWQVALGIVLVSGCDFSAVVAAGRARGNSECTQPQSAERNRGRNRPVNRADRSEKRRYHR